MYTLEDRLYIKCSEYPYNFAIIFENLFTYSEFQIARRILQHYPIWDIAASRILEIVGVLLTRASQEGSASEMALTHLPHNYPLGIWNPSKSSIRS